MGAPGVLGDLATALNDGSGAFLAPAVFVASLAALVVRLRRSRGIERQQLKFLAFAGAVPVSAFALSFIVLAVSDGVLVDVLFVIGFASLMLIPVAVAVAILRYRLYEIDRVISRTLVYGVLTLVLGAVYAGLVLAGQAVFSSFAGGSDLAIAVSTLLVAALFLPLRAWVQRVVDRRFYRRGYDAQRTLDAFGARLREQVELERLRADLERAVRETCSPPTWGSGCGRPAGDAGSQWLAWCLWLLSVALFATGIALQETVGATADQDSSPARSAGRSRSSASRRGRSRRVASGPERRRLDLLRDGPAARRHDPRRGVGCLHARREPGALPGGMLAAWVSSWSWFPLGALVAFLALLFPDGLVPCPRWRRVLRVVGLAARVAHGARRAPAGPAERGGEPRGPTTRSASAHSTAGRAARDRRPLRAVRRGPRCRRRALPPLARGRAEQLKWMTYSLVVLALAAAESAAARQRVGEVTFPVALALLPVAVAVAMLKYRLYDVDVVIRKTLVYGALSAVLAAVYVGAVVGGAGRARARHRGLGPGDRRLDARSSPRSSCPCAAPCRGRSTAASTGDATTRSGRSMRSARGCASTSSSTGCAPTSSAR